MRERDTIFYAVLGIAALLIVLLILDGYFFFVAFGPRHVPPASARAPLSDREIDEAIRILDARAKKFNEIMGTPAEATNAEK